VADVATGSKLCSGKGMDFYLYKRLDNGAFHWPRSADEALEISEEQYRMLMQGLEVVAKHPIRELEEPPDLM